jgi:CheY-like chemotaxis protein
MDLILKNILLIDDDINDVSLMKTALKESHFSNEIIVAEDGEVGLDLLYRRGKFSDYKGELPAFILLDIKMPMMNGIEVLKIIREDHLFDKIPVVMMTSSRDVRDLDECYKYGANSFIVKPVNITDFIRVIKEVGQYWGVINETQN